MGRDRFDRSTVSVNFKEEEPKGKTKAATNNETRSDRRQPVGETSAGRVEPVMGKEEPVWRTRHCIRKVVKKWRPLKL